MSRELRVHFLPRLFDSSELRGGVAVVIDVLRASTTIIHALANGAKAVIPVAEVDEARQALANRPRGAALSGGERGGTRIAGFDLDNSPSSYARATVDGKTIVFTTTNGTRALLQSSEADRIFVGAFTNLSAVVDALAADGRPVHLVCAGTEGRITSEDVLCAGAIAVGVEQAGGSLAPDDSRDMAMSLYRECEQRPSGVYEMLCRSRGGRNLLELGYDADIRVAAERNLFSVVPEYDPRFGTITISGGRSMPSSSSHRITARLETNSITE
jgi:2-phosphosulfolactate phosphatase